MRGALCARYSIRACKVGDIVPGYGRIDRSSTFPDLSERIGLLFYAAVSRKMLVKEREEVLTSYRDIR